MKIVIVDNRMFREMLILANTFMNNLSFKSWIEVALKKYEIRKCCSVAIVYNVGGAVLEANACSLFTFNCININCLEGEVGGKTVNTVLSNMFLSFF